MPPSIHDEIENAAIEAAISAVIREVLEKMDHSKPIASMTKRDIKRIAVSAISGWIVKRTELSAQSVEKAALDLAERAPIYSGL